jgi:hypothetical protein
MAKDEREGPRPEGDGGWYFPWTWLLDDASFVTYHRRGVLIYSVWVADDERDDRIWRIGPKGTKTDTTELSVTQLRLLEDGATNNGDIVVRRALGWPLDGRRNDSGAERVTDSQRASAARSVTRLVALDFAGRYGIKGEASLTETGREAYDWLLATTGKTVAEMISFIETDVRKIPSIAQAAVEWEVSERTVRRTKKKYGL